MPWNEHAFSSSKPLVVGVWVTSEVNQYLSCFVDQHLGCLVDPHMGYFVVMVSLSALQLSDSLIFWVVAGFQRIFLNVGSVLIFKSPLIAAPFLMFLWHSLCDSFAVWYSMLLASCWGLWNFIACCNEAPVLGRHSILGSWGCDKVSAPVPSLFIVLIYLSLFLALQLFGFFFFPCSFPIAMCLLYFIKIQLVD